MRSSTSVRARAAILCLVSLSACRSRAALTDVVEARHLASELRVDFTKTVEASNRAVMADTDRASEDAAKEARNAAAAVERTVSALRSRLAALGDADDQARLEDFGKRFAEYRQLDQQILALAVENTNLKAQRLLFEDARRASDEFRRAVGVAGGPAGSSAAVSRAEISVLEVQVTLARHIAESDDAAMTAMEQEIRDHERAARAAVNGLGTSAGPARATLDRFEEVVQRILSLSRRNSNVRSLALSLGRKRVVTTQCDETLAALERAVLAHRFTATR